MRRRIAIKLAGGCILLFGIAASLWLIPTNQYVAFLSGWAERFGPAGAFLLASLYIPACLFFVPGWILSVGIGFLYGVAWGTISVSLGSLAGAAAAFLAGRTLFRDGVKRRVAAYPRFAALDRAVARNGFTIVLLTRLSPVFPFNLLNYAFGVTGISLGKYALASWIGMLPGTVLYVYLGSAGNRLEDVLSADFSGHPGPQVLFWLGLLAAVLVAAFITRIAKHALNESIALEAADVSGAVLAVGGVSDAADAGEDVTRGEFHAR